MSEASPPPRQRKLLIYLVVAFAVILAAMFGWKELSLFRLEHRIAKEREAEHAEMALHESQIRDAAVARVTEMLDLFSMPLAWSIRAEAMKQDYAQIEEYMLQLIKQPSVLGAAFVDNDGVVRLATDRKYEGAQAQQLYGDLLNADEVVLRELDGQLRLMIPVVGLSERIGSFVVSFSRDALLQPFG